MTNDDFNDDLSDLLGKGVGPIAKPQAPPAQYVPVEKRFEETCPKCRGRGRFVSYAGRDCGPCFHCKGEGRKVFKTSSAQRTVNRARAHVKAAEKARSLIDEIAQWQKDHAAAWQWMTVNAARGSEFAKSLTEALYRYGSLTDNQLAAVERNIAKMTTRK